MSGLCPGCLLAAAVDVPGAKAEDAFDGYDIVFQAGEGGMGIVYLAEQNNGVRREVALKVLKAGLDSVAVLRRFETERHALATMAHPNIATFYEAGISKRGYPFFAMEFVDGEPITTVCDRHALTIFERLKLFVEVCQAIEHTHRKGILHRDIKPSNVLVTERDGHLVAKVIDFGIARATSAHLTGRTVVTNFGETLGTPEYMSPEQAVMDGRAIGPASDIYCLGVLLYELVAGVLPFDSARLQNSGVSQAMRIICEEEAPAPATRFRQTGSIPATAARRKTTTGTLRRLLSGDLAKILNICLQKEPKLRYPSAGALVQDVERYLRGEAILGSGPTLRYFSQKLLRRYSVAVGVVAAAAIAAGLSLWMTHRPVRPTVPLAIQPLTSFTGTELAPSFSPDGKRIAFAWDGDGGNFEIYVKPVDGGTVQRLTHDPGTDLYPKWSPDGSRLAFIRTSLKGQALYVIGANGGPERRITPLHELEAGQSGESVLAFRQTPPAWSPDGKSIVVADSGEQPGPEALYEHFIDGSGRRKLTNAEAESAGDFLPAYSPDGKVLAFVRNGSTRGNSRIYLLKRGTDTPRRILVQERGISGLAWLSNQELIFSSNRSGPNMLWRLSVDGGEPSAVLGAGRGMSLISYCPIKGRVAFSQQSSNTNVWRFDVRSRGVAPIKLLASSRHTESAEWSPDGTQIAFVSNRLGTRQIWLANADGSNASQLSTVGSEVPIGTPRWSSDGHQIVYDTVSKGHSAIGIMSADGSNAHIFAADRWDDMMPYWSHNGETIYFACKVNDFLQVCRKSVSGGATTMVTRHGGGEVKESTDGRTLFYAREEGIWQVPSGGGNETAVDTLEQVKSQRYWAVAGNGIYFLRGTTKPWTVFRYDLTTHITSAVTTLAVQPDFGSPGLSLSPDLAYLLAGQVDELNGNIMVVEGVFPE